MKITSHSKIRFIGLGILLSFLGTSAIAQSNSWPKITTEMRPGARWWWLGSAVDKTNLTYNLE